MGAFETDPVKIANIMAEWLDPANKAEFKQMAHRSAALGRPQAVYNIVQDLALMADELGAAARQVVSCCGKGSRKQKELLVGQLAAA